LSGGKGNWENTCDVEEQVPLLTVIDRRRVENLFSVIFRVHTKH
jgi:hypothetical protein